MSTTTAAATVVRATFSGGISGGPILIDGVLAGDTIVALIPDSFLNWFEPVVSVNGQLQQILDRDGSDVSFTVYFIRGV